MELVKTSSPKTVPIQKFEPPTKPVEHHHKKYEKKGLFSKLKNIFVEEKHPEVLVMNKESRHLKEINTKMKKL